MSTNGLVQPHFIPAAHDHGMPVTTAAGLLAVVGLFDIAGTIFSGWLTDRIDPRILLLAYYGLRGFSLFLLPPLFGPDLHVSMIAFIVFYGLDWVATVPPTLALCREHFGARAPVVFGWVFASHQLGSAVAAFGGGVIRDVTGSYDLAWFVAGALCMLAAVMSFSIRRNLPPAVETALPTNPEEAAACPGPRLRTPGAGKRERARWRDGSGAGPRAPGRAVAGPAGTAASSPRRRWPAGRGGPSCGCSARGAASCSGPPRSPPSSGRTVRPPIPTRSSPRS